MITRPARALLAAFFLTLAAPVTAQEGGPAYVDIDSEEMFEDQVIDASRIGRVVVLAWAPWCGPCRTLFDTLARLAPRIEAPILRLDVDQVPAGSAHLSIQSIPAFVAVEDGEVADELVGAVVDDDALLAFLGAAP